MTHRVHAYARAVLSGQIVAGRLVRLACERHEREIANAKTLGIEFREIMANHAINFIEQFVRLPDTDDENGQAKPFVLQPWQVFIVGSLFGWYLSTGQRRFRNAYMEIGKGNGKTPMLAAIGLYGLTMDGQKAPEVYAAAADRDQAMIMFRDAVRMVDSSPKLSAQIKKHGIEHVYNLSYGLGFFRPFSREQSSKSGTRPHMGLIDELHEHPNAEIVNKIRAGAKGNMNAMFPEITNSGSDRTSICWQHHEHSIRVLEGVVADLRWFAYVCALDEGDEPLQDEACWPKVNPNLGVSIHPEYLRDQVSAAKNIPAETNSVLRLNFCVWTQAHTRFLDVSKWIACEGTISDAERVGAACYGGLDLGQSDDFTAFVLIWALKDGRVATRPYFWMPQSAVTRFPHRPYPEWQRAAAMTITGGDVVDYGIVEADIKRLCHQFGVRQVCYDKRFAEQMSQNLVGAGVSMVHVPQGWNMTEALRKLSDLVTSETLIQDGNPIQTWMAANLMVRQRDTQLRPDKEKASEKIDGQVALVMALENLVRQPEEKGYSLVVYG